MLLIELCAVFYVLRIRGKKWYPLLFENLAKYLQQIDK